MLPTIEMLAKKNRLPTRMLCGLLLVMSIAGCTPSGPRALLRGKKLLDSGDFAGAVTALQTATVLLPSNAAAWNYLGVAYQKTQQVVDSANAYQRALALNRDLVEAHWNLGMLYFEQNNNDQALSEFTAYTLRRSNTPEGWLKLGAVQLRLGQIVPAEKSLSWVLKLNPNNAEAMNGLGLACLERNRPRDAVQWFAADNQAHPEYPPAILNLAVTAQQYLHDNQTALKFYRAYLTLTPRPDNWEDVSSLANTLEQGMMVATAPPQVPATEPQKIVPPTVVTQPPQVQPVPVENRKPVTVAVRAVPAQKPPAQVRNNPAPVVNRPAPVVKAQPQPPAPQPQIPVQTVPVTVAPTITKIPEASLPQIEPPPAETNQPAKPSFWQKLKPTRWFEPPPIDKKYETTGLVDETNNSGAAASTTTEAAPSPAGHPLKMVTSFARYGYLAPARPSAGDRRAASGSFTRARVYEQAAQWMDAMQAYKSAAEFDPAWFEAQYNFGVLSYRLGIQRQALVAYEMALAIQPDSVDARYNFALALKASNYVTDAVNELKKVLAANPDEVRAHLALANLYAQKIHDVNQARDHYLKVLDLDPNNPQAPDIRYWLSANSQ